jgi:DNA polymerase-3 subunit gamma/tau
MAAYGDPMSYLVFALKWRPQRFADVTGQGAVSRTLSNALKTERTAHAYLFSGPRGVGKTTMARILAKALNCEKGPAEEPCNECLPCREITSGRAIDVIEIDGASNRGIDDIRELRESARYSPAMLRRKVYIIDEVHMLTQDAFNALLKTLEEPPAHVVFILATTEPLKVPQTILSRCQRFDFARLSVRDSSGRLRFICEREGIAFDEDALLLIARKGDGSMRDALTLLDQVVATGLSPLTAQGVRDALGIAGRELYFEWSEAITERDAARALRSVGGAVEGGANLQELAEEFLGHLRNLLLAATDPSLAELIDATEEERAAYLQQAGRLAQADLLRYCRILLEAAGQMRRSSFPRTLLEVAVAEMCTLPTALELKRFIDVTRKRFPAQEEPGAAGATGYGPGALAAGGSAGSPRSGRPTAGATPRSGSRAGSVERRPESAESGAEPGGTGAEPGGTGAELREAESVPEAESVREVESMEPRPESVDSEPAGGSVREIAVETAQVATASSGSLWSTVLACVASQKPALASYLAGSEPAGELGRMLLVRVPGLSRYKQEQLERKQNRQYLMDLVSKEYGRQLGIRFEAGDAAEAAPAPGGNGSAASGAERPTRPRSAEKAGRVAPQEKIRHIADLFGGDVIGPA